MAANLHKTNLMLMLTVLRDHIVMSHLHLAKMAALMWPGPLHSSFFITLNMKHAQKDKSIIHIELTDISMKLPQLLTDIKIISVCIAIVKIFC